MNAVGTLALVGGLFAVLTFIHFFVDWLFQSHSEAMIKHNHPWVRAKHCAIYTLGFLPFFYLCGFSFWEWIISINILFWSHHLEDSYVPVYLWAKYIRRPPEMFDASLERQYKEARICERRAYYSIDYSPGAKSLDECIERVIHLEEQRDVCAKIGFGQFVATPLGKILMIVVDQIIHLAFLFPVAYIALGHL